MKTKRKQKQKINPPVLDFVTHLSLEQCRMRVEQMHNPPQIEIHPSPQRTRPMEYEVMTYCVSHFKHGTFQFRGRRIVYQVNVRLHPVEDSVHVLARIHPRTLDKMRPEVWGSRIRVLFVGCSVIALGVTSPLMYIALAAWIASYVVYVRRVDADHEYSLHHRLLVSPVVQLIDQIRNALNGPVL